jgi:predicted kinase
MQSTPPPGRSVKIANDERSGWSSDRPRRDGDSPRPVDISVRCRVLAATDRLRYSPGSLVVVVAPSLALRERFDERLAESRASMLSLAKVRSLLAGRVAEAEAEVRARQLLDAAVAKRLEANETVVVAAEGLDPAEREPYARMAAAQKRPRHVILLDTGRDQVEEGDRSALNDLRRRLDAGELGAEGFQTALRLSERAVAELRGIVFRPPPRDS